MKKKALWGVKGFCQTWDFWRAGIKKICSSNSKKTTITINTANVLFILNFFASSKNEEKLSCRLQLCNTSQRLAHPRPKKRPQTTHTRIKKKQRNTKKNISNNTKEKQRVFIWFKRCQQSATFPRLYRHLLFSLCPYWGNLLRVFDCRRLSLRSLPHKNLCFPTFTGRA